jgi:methyltransferase, FkbM family
VIDEHDNRFVILRNRNGTRLICRIREGFDIGHIVEIFEEGTYLQDFQNGTVIDVGASTADSSIYFALKGARDVYAIEPTKESFDFASENVRLNNLEGKVHLINAALSSDSGQIELTVSSDNPNANSIDPTETVKKSGINFDSKRVIDSITLKDIVSQYNISKIKLLKMDCEGCEYEVLQKLEEEMFSIIDNIILEFHDGLKFLADLLEKRGYNVKYDKTNGSGILRASRNSAKPDYSNFNSDKYAV